MSEAEKIRAVSLVSVIAITLALMVSLQGRTAQFQVPVRSALEICAASKGAVCDLPANQALAAPIRHANVPVSELGAMIIVASPLGLSDADLLAAADLGRMTVTAPSLASENGTVKIAASEAQGSNHRLL